MNNVNLKIAGYSSSQPAILVDDKTIKMKKNEFGGYECSFQTEKETIDIKIFKFLEINGPCWFLLYMFYFLIGIFGIFDVKLEKKCLIIDYHSTITLKENSTIQIKFLTYPDNKVSCETDCEIQQLNNRCEIDNNAKKKLKILKITKIILWLALISCGLVFGFLIK